MRALGLFALYSAVFLPVMFFVWWWAMPLAVLLANKHTGRVPWLLQWVETHDAPGWEGPQTETATRKWFERSKRLGLLRWLARNRAYRLRYWMRARPTDLSAIVEHGARIPPAKGRSYWYGSVDGFFEFQPRLSWGYGYFYLRLGWKMKQWVGGQTPGPNSPVGVFTLSIRHDDWDDFPEGVIK